MDPTDTIAARTRRWREFYNPDHPRTRLIQVTVGDPLEDRPPLWPEYKQERIEWAWRLYRKQVERMARIDDDTIPYLHVSTGTEIVPRAFGCPVHRPSNERPFALPLIHSASEVAPLRVPGLDTPCLAILFEIADELHGRAPEAILKTTDIQCPMDWAALIWEKCDFFAAMIEAPEAVHELAGKVKSVEVAFYDEWISRYGREFIAHYPDYYMPGGIAMAVDEIGSIGAEMFNEFHRPELCELSARYGGIGIHCCAHARHQWDNLRSVPGLLMLNLVQSNEVLAEAYRYFSDHPAQMHSWCGDDPVEWCRGLPPHARVVVHAQVESEEQGRVVAERFRALE